MVPAWLWLAAIALVCWGTVGLLQKMCTNHLSSESAFLWTVAGFVMFLPLIHSSESLLSYPPRGLLLALLSGVLNALASWALLAAMRNGGKASVVGPLIALYPLVVVVMAPFLLGESITWLQCLGVACALASIILLSS